VSAPFWSKGWSEKSIEPAPELEHLWFMDFRCTGMVWAGEGSATVPEIGSVSVTPLQTTQRILDTYLPATTA
jgi:hypothetical protein